MQDVFGSSLVNSFNSVFNNSFFVISVCFNSNIRFLYSCFKSGVFSLVGNSLFSSNFNSFLADLICGIDFTPLYRNFINMS